MQLQETPLDLKSLSGCLKMLHDWATLVIFFFFNRSKVFSSWIRKDAICLLIMDILLL
jgi:hypothetical protein